MQAGRRGKHNINVNMSWEKRNPKVLTRNSRRIPFFRPRQKIIPTHIVGKRLRRLALRYFAKQARLFFLTLHNHRPWHTPWLPPARTSTNGSATSRPRPPTWSRRGGRRSFVETTRTKHLLLLLLLAVPPPPPRHDMGGAGRFLDSSRFLLATCSCSVSLRPSRCGIMAKAT